MQHLRVIFKKERCYGPLSVTRKDDTALRETHWKIIFFSQLTHTYMHLQANKQTHTHTHPHTKLSHKTLSENKIKTQQQLKKQT